jgi:hypothetical protein
MDAATMRGDGLVGPGTMAKAELASGDTGSGNGTLFPRDRH